MFTLLLSLLACEAPPSDRAGAPSTLGPVAQALPVRARAVRVEGASSSRVELDRGDGAVVVLVDHGNPDRVALSPDGAHVAYVSAASGLASVWIVDAQKGATPRQLTNVGLESLPRTPGEPPAGWVAPPHQEGSLRFEDDSLAWDSPDGPQRVVWR